MANFAGYEKEDVLNGIGIRCVLWFSGCSHGCEDCFNKRAWNPKYGERITDSFIDKIMVDLDSPYISGLTLTGGDPLFTRNIQTVIKIVKLFRDKFGSSKNIWLYTGYTIEEIIDSGDLYKAVEGVDTVVDGKFISNLKCTDKPFRGSSNQRLINVKSFL